VSIALGVVISPNQVSVSATQDFTLTVTNPSSQLSVTINASTGMPNQDSIYVSGVTGVTASPGSIKPVPPAGTPWQIGIVDTSKGKTIKIWVTSAVTLQPGQSVQFQLPGVLIDDTPGSATLPVLELLGGQSIPGADIQIGKLAATLQISAFSNPDTVGLGQSATLQWTIVQGQYVTINPAPPDHPDPFYRQQPKGWDTAQWNVTPAQDAPQTNYELTVWQDLSHWQKTTALVNLSGPRVDVFSADQTAAVSINQIVNLTWAVRYGRPVTLRPSLGAGYVQPEGMLAITPQALLARTSNDSQLQFTLSASGFRGTVTKTLQLTFAPLRIAYFRYTDFTKQNIDYDVENSTSISIANPGTNSYIMTATGPGGPLTQTLGGTGLEIQVLVADPPQLQAGQKTTLSYQVQGAVSLVLEPGGTKLPLDGSGRGSFDVTPQTTTTYTLTATDINGNQVTSDLQIPVGGQFSRLRFRRNLEKRRA
jgi:hypothetical protein